MPDDDYYELLGISPNATDDELRGVWRQLAMKWHPDRAGADVTFIFQKLSAAYEVLRDPTTRAAYDATRSHPSLGRAPSVLIRRLSSPIEVLLACGAARRADDGLIELFVEPDEAREGGMITIAMHVPVRSDTGTVEERFSAWLALRPGVSDGTVLEPSVQLAGVITPVRFRVRLV